MPARPRIGVVALSAALLAAVIPGSARAVSPTAPGPAVAHQTPVKKAGGSQTITLVTGDKLKISADAPQSFTVLPSSGRQNTRFLSRTVKDHLQVVPADAAELLQKGLLDPRLFDVTQLLADGFGDAKTSRLRLIVSTGGAGVRGLTTTGSRELRAVKAEALTQDKKDAAALWRSLVTARGLTAGVRKVWLDGVAHTSLDVSVPQIGAPVAWAAGYTGNGVDVGLIDSGVDTTHPDLAGAVVESQNFLDTPPAPGTPPGPPFPPEDDNDRAGHGSHVASIIAGRGTASGGKYTGVAPKAKIYSAKVCNQFGVCPESAILAGMQWVAEKKIRVANMSLGQANWPGLDPLEQAVQDLTAQYGTLFVVASGNDGGPANSPSTAPDALSVGAVDKQDNIAPFSSGGSIQGELAAKPEVTAPGVNITAAQSSFVAGYDGNPYVMHSGTSMATPHVTGAVAILAQEHPDWTAAQLKASLVTSAKLNPAVPPNKQGGGRIDVGKAISQTVTAAPIALSFGEHPWPHDHDTPVSQAVTYSNSGTAPVTLALSVTSVYDWTGAPQPGLATLSADSVTVPAGGRASVTVTGNPAVETPAGFFSGTVTAASAGATINTPWVLFKDEEAYDFTLKNIDRTGKPTDRVRAELYGLNGSGVWGMNIDPDGTGTIRLPAGRYTLSVEQFSGGHTDDDIEMTEIVRPLVNLTKDTAAVADGRTARPLSVTVPQKGATQFLGHVHFTFATTSGTWLGQDLTGPNFDRLYTAQLGPDDKTVLTTVSALFAKKDASGGKTDSPYLYNLAWNLPGRYTTGFTRKVAAKDLATVHASFASEGDNTVGESSTSYRPIGQKDRGWATSADFHLPFHRTDYYNADGGGQWQSEHSYGDFLDGDQRYLAIRVADWTRYSAGKTYTASWNKAVYGPAFLPWKDDSGATRTGDQLYFGPDLVSDGLNRGSWAVGSAHTTVTRDGTVIQDDSSSSAELTIPPAAADYRVTISADRAAPAVLAKNVTATWTFRSGHTAGPVALGVAAIRISPPVDDHNVAHPGKNGGLAVPVTIGGQPGSAAGVCRSLTVQVSFDDGTTWTAAHVTGTGNRQVAQVRHPAGHGFVTIKATAASASGSTVEETILRAYQF
ncbi:MAG: hypothetical protein QOI35_3049 [Cryptosporangiaceae bacterium]|nr:hypothetical protein [Cryptosporangiaceae bacterium]